MKALASGCPESRATAIRIAKPCGRSRFPERLPKRERLQLSQTDGPAAQAPCLPCWHAASLCERCSHITKLAWTGWKPVLHPSLDSRIQRNLVLLQDVPSGSLQRGARLHIRALRRHFGG